MEKAWLTIEQSLDWTYEKTFIFIQVSELCGWMEEEELKLQVKQKSALFLSAACI
jgi:hypothetical protein